MSRADLAVAAVCATGAAVAYGAAAALQHDQAGQVERREAYDVGLVATLATRPLWLAGIAADTLAFVLQAVALRFGAVVLVQLLLVLGLPVGAGVSALLASRSLRRREVLGMLLCGAGLVAAVPGSTLVDLGHTAGTGTLLVTSVLVLAVIGGLVAASRLRRALAPVLLGVAAGTAAGATSVVLAACAAQIGAPLALLRTPSPYALAVFGPLALMLTQSAFQTGSLATPWAALSVTEPVVAVPLAVVLLREQLPTSLLVLSAGAVGVLLAAAGVLVLARQSEDEHAVVVSRAG